MANKKQKFSEHEMARRRDALRGYMGKTHAMVSAYQEILKSWKKKPLQLTKGDFQRIIGATRAGDYEMMRDFLTQSKNKRGRMVG